MKHILHKIVSIDYVSRETSMQADFCELTQFDGGV